MRTSNVCSGSIVFAQMPSDELKLFKKSYSVVPDFCPEIASTAEFIMPPKAPIVMPHYIKLLTAPSTPAAVPKAPGVNVKSKY